MPNFLFWAGEFRPPAAPRPLSRSRGRALPVPPCLPLCRLRSVGARPGPPAPRPRAAAARGPAAGARRPRARARAARPARGIGAAGRGARRAARAPAAGPAPRRRFFESAPQTAKYPGILFSLIDLGPLPIVRLFAGRVGPIASPSAFEHVSLRAVEGDLGDGAGEEGVDLLRAQPV